MQTTLSWLTIITNFAAALLWWHSATFPVPINDIKSGWGSLTGVEEVSAAFNLQADWNAWAAGVTGMAVLFQALSLILAIPRRG
jgi:hypothetical protein